tara:strand:- start:122 stop:274 length:153 start_codon:yes stop_codon:yes gene_type:complete
MITKLFDRCVSLLERLAKIAGVSYEAINVIIFVLLYPLIILGLITWLILK